MSRYNALLARSICAISIPLVASTQAASQPGATPAVDSSASGLATTTAAAKVIDLRTFPQLPKAKPRRPPVLASISYEAPGSVKEGFAFIVDKLSEQKWTELPGGYQSDQSSNGTFERDGYTLSVSVSKGRSDAEKTVDVQIINHGNVDLSKLPTPPGTESLYNFPVTSMFVTEVSVAKTVAALRKLLMDAGWEPYGTAGDTQQFRQNAVQLSATVASSPAQQGKTMINFTAQLMSLEIPLIPNAERAQYSDSPTQLSFDTQASFEEVSKFYRESLAQYGWKATRDELTKIGFRHFLIFRNQQKDMLKLRLNSIDGKSRGFIEHSTADQVAKANEKIEADRRKRQTEANKPKPKVTIKLPADAKGIDASAREIEFKVTIGKAKSTTEAIQKQLIALGWKAENVTLGSMFGTVTMKKGQQSISLTYIETGVLAPEITVNSSDIELSQGK